MAVRPWLPLLIGAMPSASTMYPSGSHCQPEALVHGSGHPSRTKARAGREGPRHRSPVVEYREAEVVELSKARGTRA